MKLDIAINNVCSRLFFGVSTLKCVLKSCKTYDFTVFKSHIISCCIQKKESGL